MSCDPSCGCCDGIEVKTPRLIYNRSGLTEIDVRVGAYGDFFESMIARLTSHALPNGTRPLQRLRTRDPADPSIALLDAWAVVADVLSFYQERIATEGYLPTAIQRRSILELGRLVGYRLRPGVSASVYLAFSLEDGYEVTVPAGTLARSLPGPGENAEPFETSEPLKARASWNALPLRMSRPFVLFPPAEGATETVPGYLAGTATGLAAGQMILVTRGTLVVPYDLRSVTPDFDLNLTRIEIADRRAIAAPARPAERPEGQAAFSAFGGALAAVRLPPSAQPPSRFDLTRDPARTYAASADLTPQLLAAFSPQVRGPLLQAFGSAAITRPNDPVPPGIEALRVDAALFGAIAPLEFVYSPEGSVARREWGLAEVRSSLSVIADASSGDSVASAFAAEVDLIGGETAPLRLMLRGWDPMSAVRQTTVSLDEFGAADDTGLARLTRKIDDLRLEFEAQYEGEASVWLLRSVRVIWHASSGSGIRRLRFGPSFSGHTGATAAEFAAAAPTMLVELDFRTETGSTVVAATPEAASYSGGPGSTVTLQLDAEGTTLSLSRSERWFAGTPEAPRILSFDGEYPAVTAGGRLVVEGPLQRSAVYNVLDARVLARSDYGLSQRVTLALLDRPWLSGIETSLADIRSVTIHAGNEALTLAEEPLTADLAGLEAELGGLYEGLEAGRWVAVRGERTDVLGADGAPIPGVDGVELAMLAGVEHRTAEITDPNGEIHPLPGDTLHTRLTFAEPLAYAYKRDTALVNANVVIATHGETVRETIGSGDSTQRLQIFDLKGKPLTHVSAPTPSGAESTLEIRVNGIRWHEERTLFPLGPTNRAYQSQTDNDGATSVTFGDGTHAARLPSGAENVAATYRIGIGAAGNLAGGKIATLGPKPLGVKEVTNPRLASGGADPETRDQARLRAPLATKALDRLVSVDDYTDFATLYAGIDKARAARLSDGRRVVLHLSLAAAGDHPLDPQSDLWRNLMGSLAAFGDPALPVVMAPREAAFVFLSAKVRAKADYLWENVEPALRHALLDAFGFGARALGQPLRLSEVVAAVQKVPGVDYVDVDLFEAVTETDAETPETLAARLAEFAALTATAVPRPWLAAALARREGEAIRPAQILYLNPDLPDTLILTEASA